MCVSTMTDKVRMYTYNLKTKPKPQEWKISTWERVVDLFLINHFHQHVWQKKVFFSYDLLPYTVLYTKMFIMSRLWIQFYRFKYRNIWNEKLFVRCCSASIPFYPTNNAPNKKDEKYIMIYLTPYFIHYFYVLIKKKIKLFL